jgi:crotonobetainyl-CoA:carnitine CoA-transferase CaiB-like acyl-CoA transferase
VRITGHGTDGDRADWVAFGDDAAVAGGLVAGSSTAPEFCGDAIADPLTGLHAAVAVAQSMRSGGGELVELSMAAVAATYAELPRTPTVRCTAAPELPGSVAALGDDKAAVMQLIAEKRSLPC